MSDERFLASFIFFFLLSAFCNVVYLNRHRPWTRSIIRWVCFLSGHEEDVFLVWALGGYLLLVMVFLYWLFAN